MELLDDKGSVMYSLCVLKDILIEAKKIILKLLSKIIHHNYKYESSMRIKKKNQYVYVCHIEYKYPGSELKIIDVIYIV